MPRVLYDFCIQLAPSLRSSDNKDTSRYTNPIVLVIVLILTGDSSSCSNSRQSSSKKMNESRSTEGLSVAGMSNLSMTSDSVLRCTSMCTRAAEYLFHKGQRVSQAIVDSRNIGEGDLPKALDQVNGKFLVRYELGLFGLPFSPLTHLLIYKKSLSPFHNNKVSIQLLIQSYCFNNQLSSGSQVKTSTYTGPCPRR